MRRRHEERVAAELAERTHGVECALRSTIHSFEDEAAHRRIDRCQVTVQELLGVVRLGGDMRTFAELEHGLEHRRRVAPCARDDEAIVIRRSERLGIELAEDLRCETGDVLPLERSSGRDRGRVAGRVAVALLDRGSRHDDVIDGLRERALRRAGDQPRLAREPAHRFERQRGPAFVRDRDEDVGLGRVPENDLERLRSATAREGRVVRRAAAGEQDARALGQPAIADPLGHLPKPLGLLGDGLSGQLSGHEACLYHRTPWPSSRRRRWATGFAS